MRIEEYILRKLTDNFDSKNYLNDWDANQVAYFVGVNDAIACVKAAVMEHYNDNLAGENEIARFCVENNCNRCDTCEHSYYVYGSEMACKREFSNGCASEKYKNYEQTKPLRNKARFGC